MPVHKSEIWYREIQLVKIINPSRREASRKGGESSGRPSLGDCDNICEGNLLFRVIFGKFMHRWFLICAQLGSYNVSFLHYRPPKLKYGFFRGSFARLTSQSQAGTLSSHLLMIRLSPTAWFHRGADIAFVWFPFCPTHPPTITFSASSELTWNMEKLLCFVYLTNFDGRRTRKTF